MWCLLANLAGLASVTVTPAAAQVPAAQNKPAVMSPAAPMPAPPPLGLPIDCVIGESCFVQNYVDIVRSSQSRDWTCGTRTYDAHDGIDFRLLSLAAQAKGVAVLAAAPGRVRGVRDGELDISVRQRGKDAIAGRECGNGVVIEHEGGWTTQYCHMAKGSLRVKLGAQVKAGEPLGLVGLSGNTEYPHLHFVLRQGARVVEPFAFDLQPGACGRGHRSAWAPDVAARLAYVERSVLNAGFAAGPVTNEGIEAGSPGPQPDTAAPAFVAYVRAIGLKRGDVQRITLTGPSGKTELQGAAEPLDRDKAQTLFFIGRRRGDQPFKPARYEALYEVIADGKVVLSHRMGFDLAPPATPPPAQP